MSNAIFPVLKGRSWGCEKTPVFNNVIVTHATGSESRAALYRYPLWQYTLSYEVVEDSENMNSDFKTIMGFFLARTGSYDDFLYSDPADLHSEFQLIGVGDGVKKDFQLLHSIGGFVEPVSEINGTPVIELDEPTTAFTLSRGVVHFDTAPADGVPVTADFDFYRRVRFGPDKLTFKDFAYNLYELKKIELFSVR
jgi:uncharacterized protein (TIGR02217 family)